MDTRAPLADGTGLLAVKLNDQLFVNIAVYIVTFRQIRNNGADLAVIGRYPRRPSASDRGLPGSLYVRVLLGCVLDGNLVADLDLERRNVDLSAVHHHVSMIDQLPRLSSGGRKAGPEHCVIEPSFKHEEKVLARDPFLSRGFLEVIAELLFQNEIDPFDLLLLAKLFAVALEHPPPGGRTVLTGRLRAALFDRARRLVATVALQE